MWRNVDGLGFRHFTQPLIADRYVSDFFDLPLDRDIYWRLVPPQNTRRTFCDLEILIAGRNPCLYLFAGEYMKHMEEGGQCIELLNQTPLLLGARLEHYLFAPSNEEDRITSIH